MKRWQSTEMTVLGRKLFASVHKRKAHAHHNHEIHDMARDVDRWLIPGIDAMLKGDYTPRHLKRVHFKDETIDHLHLFDRIFQHILLKQLKATFPFVMNRNCYHLHGPTGVKYATQRIRQALKDKKTGLCDTG